MLTATSSNPVRRGSAVLLLSVWWAVLVLVALATRAATPPSPVPIYSGDEATRLSFCFVTSRIAEQVAHKKLNHEPLEVVATEYDRKNAQSELRELIGALVKEVYQDEFTDSLVYAVDFFKESAAVLAGVPLDRVSPATVCMQNSLAVDMVHTYRLGGLGKDKVTELLARHNREVPRHVIDLVYAAPLEQGDMSLTVWNECMAPTIEPHFRPVAPDVEPKP